MKEEKAMILKMLEEGKISSEEAIKLLDALEGENPQREDRSDKSKEEKQERYNLKETFETLEEIGSDIGNALSDVFDGLVDFGSSFTMKNNYESVTNNLEMDLSEIESPSLDLKAVNGHINLKPIEGETLYIKVSSQYKKGLLSENEAYFTFDRVDEKIIFSPNYNTNISIKLDVSIPEKHYKEILLNTSNGKIEILDISSDTIKSYTKNSPISLKEIDSKDIDLKTSNSNIILNDIKAEGVSCKTSNSPIDVKLIDARDILLTSSNGKISLSEANIYRAENINLITSNSSIVSELHDINKETIFDIETSMGNIELNLDNLIYSTNKHVNLGLKKIVANTLGYDEDKDHLKFKAYTSNGAIKVN